VDPRGFARSELPGFLIAVQFLTRLPLPFEVGYTPEAARASPRWYPGAGVLIGVITAVIYWSAALLFPPLIAVLVSVAVGLVVTGGLHEDGFADACDGLGGMRPRERVLEIMRDSRIGTYGVLGLGLMVGTKVAALAALPGVAVPFLLIAGHAASRASMLWVMASSDYVRGSGAASAVAGGIDQRAVQIGLVTTALAVVPLLFVLPFVAVLTGLAGLVAGHYLMRNRFERRLGGYTGDCLGAVQQCSEVGFLLGVVVLVN
jgi:adenosylcobinamide-GDP ribazoletransferase